MAPASSQGSWEIQLASSAERATRSIEDTFRNVAMQATPLARCCEVGVTGAQGTSGRQTKGRTSRERCSLIVRATQTLKLFDCRQVVWNVVARDGIEPPTPAFSGPRSTTELSGQTSLPASPAGEGQRTSGAAIRDRVGCVGKLARSGPSLTFWNRSRWFRAQAQHCGKQLPKYSNAWAQSPTRAPTQLPMHRHHLLLIARSCLHRNR